MNNQENNTLKKAELWLMTFVNGNKHKNLFDIIENALFRYSNFEIF